MSTTSTDARPLSGKVAVVTGASGGIGAGACSLRKSTYHSRLSAGYVQSALRRLVWHALSPILTLIFCENAGTSDAAAIARALASAGAKVALGARRLEALEGVKAAIEAGVGVSDAVIIVKTDVTKRDDVSFFCCCGVLYRGGKIASEPEVCMHVHS